MKNWIFIFGLIAVVGMTGLGHAAAGGIITKEQLREIIDDPDVVVLDVRTGRDWRSSEFKIKGAVRANPSEFGEWISQQDKGKRFVTYCA